MKRCFVRGLWGKDEKTNRVLHRKGRVDGNIKYLLRKPFNEPFITYVWGSENYTMLEKLGVENLIKVSDNFFQWDLVTMQYRHKLELLRLAMIDYDEIVHLDWDCFPTKKLPIDYWETLGKKEIFQGCLFQYKKAKCYWRTIDQRKLTNGGYVYLRDKSLPDQFIKIWESDDNKNKRSCEPTMSLWCDRYCGGWEGKEKYYNLFEPESCSLHRNSPYKIIKDSCFNHWAGLGCIRE